MTLTQGLNQVGEKPLPLKVCLNSPTPVFMRSPCREDELFPLALLETDGPIVGKLREKDEVSLSTTFPLKFGFCLFPSPPPSPNRLGEDRSQVRCPLTCHKSTSKWLFGLHVPYPLIHLPWIFTHSHVATCLSWVPLELIFDSF